MKPNRTSSPVTRFKNPLLFIILCSDLMKAEELYEIGRIYSDKNLARTGGIVCLGVGIAFTLDLINQNVTGSVSAVDMISMKLTDFSIYRWSSLIEPGLTGIFYVASLPAFIYSRGMKQLKDRWESCPYFGKKTLNEKNKNALGVLIDSYKRLYGIDDLQEMNR